MLWTTCKQATRAQYPGLWLVRADTASLWLVNNVNRSCDCSPSVMRLGDIARTEWWLISLLSQSAMFWWEHVSCVSGWPGWVSRCQERSGDGHPHPATLSSASLHGAHPRNNEGETQYCARVGDGTELEECFNNFWRKLVRRFLAHLQPRVRDGAAFLALYISIL